MRKYISDITPLLIDWELHENDGLIHIKTHIYSTIDVNKLSTRPKQLDY